MGYLTKKGAVVKNWKRRYFVVNPDYSVDYFENEEVCKLLILYYYNHTIITITIINDIIITNL